MIGAPATTLAALDAALKACAAHAVACAVTLAPGAYGRLSESNYSPPAPVTITLSGASLAAVAFYGGGNFNLLGGEVDGAQNAAFTVVGGHDVTLTGQGCKAPGTACVVVVGSQRVQVLNGTVTGSGADGVDVAGSDGVTVSGWRCEAWSPAAGAHPDCVQGWSTATQRLTNFTVAGSVSVGDTEGFTVWTSAGQLAPDRVKITGNVSAQRGFAQCLGVTGATNVEVTGNECVTIIGALHPVQPDFDGSTGVFGPNTLDGVSR